MNSGWPTSTAWPFSHRMRVILPLQSDSISFMIFIASMMQTGSPSLIVLPSSTKALAPGLAER